MDKLTRGITQSEKPGRLQLAIIQWQRQLIAQRSEMRDTRAGSLNREELDPGAVSIGRLE